MKSRFAAVFTRPLRLRSDEADTRAIRVVVYAPGRREDHLDVGVAEEVRRPVRTVENADLPLAGVLGNQLAAVRAWYRACAFVGVPAEQIARAKRASAVAAESSEDERGAAVEIFGDVEAAAHGNVGTRAIAAHVSHAQLRAGPHLDRPPIA